MGENNQKAIVDEKIAYLQIIQDTINRMSTNSAIFKGFAATIVAGTAVIQYSEISRWVLVMSFLPVLSFAALDIYYLKLEKKYRILYNQVRTSSKKIDFSMDIKSISNKSKIYNVGIWSCIKTPSILIFYPVLVIVLAVISVLKINHII